MVERLIRNQQVAGSIPAGGSSTIRIFEARFRAGFGVFCQQFCQYSKGTDGRDRSKNFSMPVLRRRACRTTAQLGG